ncbi:MAG: sulfotransferase [Bacteroidetes bacterium]|nr:sulfotransferase [Bacteroidota bacterium]
MKDSYLTAGIKVDQLFRLLRRNKLTWNFKTILRLLFLLQSACWSSFFSWIEHIRFAKALKNAPVPDDPIFIIGHWRTGSTFLHQLLSLDPDLSAPTLFQVAVPDSFLVSYPYYRPVFKQVVSEHRPMDQVVIGMDEPQEDEYAIYRITSYSPLENLVFPKSHDYFLNHGSPFLPSGIHLVKWKNDVAGFFKKLYFKNRKRIVSKNPFNSYRIKTLYEMFPNSRFINIVRHPNSVVPSTIHMWTILGRQNSLNSRASQPEFLQVVKFLKDLLGTVEKARKDLPSGTMIQIRFEDLEASPVEVIQTVYRELGLSFTDSHEARIRGFMLRNKSFKKNTFSLTAEEKSLISRELEFHMKSFNYHDN